MKTIKKYSNRRLYDTDQSQYVTLEELAALIRKGHDVEVVDAKTDEDLTQAVLAQIVVESRGAARLLPVPLLTQMIRMEDDALSEFMGLYMSWAMDVYFQVKQSVGDINPYKLFGAGLPFDPTKAWGDVVSRAVPWMSDRSSSGNGSSSASPSSPTPKPEPRPDDAGDDEKVDIDLLRREIARLNERIDAMEQEKEEDG